MRLFIMLLAGVVSIATYANSHFNISNNDKPVGIYIGYPPFEQQHPNPTPEKSEKSKDGSFQNINVNYYPINNTITLKKPPSQCNRIKLGMSKKQVKENPCWGEPDHISKTTSHHTNSETWFYHNSNHIVFKKDRVSLIYTYE